MVNFRKFFEPGRRGSEADTRYFKQGSWKDRVLEGMSPADAESTKSLRSIISKKSTGKNWYYGGALADFSPLLIAPQDAEHFWVDKAYDPVNAPDAPHFEGLPGFMQQTFKPLGVDVQVRDEDEENQKEMVIDKATKVHLIPGSVFDEQKLPSEIDTVYMAGYSPNPLQALKRLKTGGLLVSDLFNKRQFFRYMHDASLTDMGFKKIAESRIQNWSFPTLDVQKNQPTIYGKDVTFSVLQKIRELSAKESQFFDYEIVLSEIVSATDVYATFYVRSQEEDESMSQALKLSFQHYAQVVNDAKADSKAFDEFKLAASEIVANLDTELNDIPDEYRQSTSARIKYVKDLFGKYNV